MTSMRLTLFEFATVADLEDRLVEDKIMSRMVAVRDDESSIMWQLRLHAAMRKLERAIGCDPVHAYYFECPVAGMSMDLFLSHTDGSFTIVEAKRGDSVRNVCAGIGQLYMYLAAARRELYPNQALINLTLVSDLPPEDSLIVGDACMMAGVKYAYAISFDELHSIVERVQEEAEQTWKKDVGNKRAFQ